MFSEIIELLKIWVVTQALTNPVIWVVSLVLFTILLFVSVMFVRFKNGWVSVVCFILLEAVSLLGIAALSDQHINTDDLHLGKGAVESCVDVTSKGVVIRKRFRTTTLPLLGLRLPESESVYLKSAKDYILQARFSGNLYVYTSSAYSGVVLSDSSFNSLNEELLKRGLCSVDVVAPKQYVALQKEAVKDKRGMWEISSVSERTPSILKYSLRWLAIVSAVCMGLGVSICLETIILKNNFLASFLIDRGKRLK